MPAAMSRRQGPAGIHMLPLCLGCLGPWTALDCLGGFASLGLAFARRLWLCTSRRQRCGVSLKTQRCGRRASLPQMQHHWCITPHALDSSFLVRRLRSTPLRSPLLPSAPLRSPPLPTAPLRSPNRDMKPLEALMWFANASWTEEGPADHANACHSGLFGPSCRRQFHAAGSGLLALPFRSFPKQCMLRHHASSFACRCRWGGGDAAAYATPHDEVGNWRPHRARRREHVLS